MQNQNHQNTQSQNTKPETAVFPRKLIENAADALWHHHCFIQDARTIASTIQHLAGKNSLIGQQAQMLIDRYDHIPYSGDSISFDLCEALEESGE